MDIPGLDVVSGKRYMVVYGDCEFLVEAVRASTVKGWWFCVSGQEKQEAVFPETAFLREVVE